jgi:hypothetical protein
LTSVTSVTVVVNRGAVPRPTDAGSLPGARDRWKASHLWSATAASFSVPNSWSVVVDNPSSMACCCHVEK